MIKVRFSIDDKTIVFSAKGHAGYDDNGKDIICASASILAYTLAQDVTDLEKTGKTKKKPSIHIEDGDMTVTCKPRRDVVGEAVHTFFVLQKGFILLAQNYPKYVSVEKLLEADSVKSLCR